MSRKVLYRAAFEMLPPEGRTLLGLAVPWDRPTKVRDLTGPPYIEAFSPDSCDASIRQRDTYPLFVRHDYTEDPLGPVNFTRSREGLLFKAPLSATKRADEALELVKDGAMLGTSVGFVPVNTVLKRMSGTVDAVKYRTGVSLREMSLTPTGFGQYAEAGVMSVRNVTDLDEDPKALLAAVDASFDGAMEELQKAIADQDWACVQQALDILTSGEVTIDQVLVMMGVNDADDPDIGAGEGEAAPQEEAPVERDMTRAHRVADRMRLADIDRLLGLAH